jgi:tRNA A37 threonylcarbamoyltransferase TsaD
LDYRTIHHRDTILSWYSESGRSEILEATLLYIVYTVKGMDLCVSGILTHVERLAKTDLAAGKIALQDPCYSLQETIFAMLVEITERVMAHTGQNQVPSVDCWWCGMQQAIARHDGGYGGQGEGLRPLTVVWDATSDCKT